MLIRNKIHVWSLTGNPKCQRLRSVLPRGDVPLTQVLAGACRRVPTCPPSAQGEKQDLAVLQKVNTPGSINFIAGADKETLRNKNASQVSGQNTGRSLHPVNVCASENFEEE